VEIPIAQLSFGAPVSLEAEIVVGREPGAKLFVCSAIHGDELNGVESIARIARSRALSGMRGVLILLPVVNLFGFIGQSRYLPDRRDLNRTFPGSPTGSLAGQIAHAMMTHVVSPCDYGIDLHTAAIHRTNLPQVRAQLADERLHRLALAFGAPVVLDASLMPGTLRAAGHAANTPILTFEGGEALRFDERSIRTAAHGVLRVMEDLGMIAGAPRPFRARPVVAHGSKWLRAPAAGVLRTQIRPGEWVDAGDELGHVASPFGEEPQPVLTDRSGIIVGMATMPVVNRGDALFHVAEIGEHAPDERIDLAAEEVMQLPPAAEEILGRA
jgi:predicted deacylase